MSMPTLTQYPAPGFTPATQMPTQTQTGFGPSASPYGDPGQQSGLTPSQPYGSEQTLPYGTPAPSFGAQPAQPFGAQPTPQFGVQPASPQPYGQPAQAQPFAAQAQPFGAPPAQAQFGMPQAPFGVQPAPAFGTQPAPAFGTPQPPAFGAQPGYPGMMAPPQNNQTMTMVIIVAVIVALGLGGLWLYNNQKDPTPPPTQPPATQPAEQPPATQPPATQPPATQPPATQPPATQPPNNNQNSGGKYAESDKFMTYILDGNPSAAYAMTGPGYQSEVTKSEFTDIWSVLGGLGCSMTWTDQEAGQLKATGEDAKKDTGTLTCGTSSAAIVLLWVAHSGSNYVMEAMDMTQ